MRLLLSADIHLKSPSTSRSSRDRLLYAKQFFQDMETLKEQYDCAHYVLGDLFDRKDQVDVKAVLHTFKYHPDFWLMGNHDYPLQAIYSRLFPFFISEPKVIVGSDFTLWMVPWMPKDKYISTLREITDHIQTEKAYLLTHVALTEGQPTEGINVIQPVSVADLYPEKWDFVTLGDYHNQQDIGNVVYTGSPWSLDYGVTNTCGVFLLDTDKNTLEDIPLPSKYPRVRKHTVVSQEFQEISYYDPEDYYWITCPSHLLAEYKENYPEARIEPLPVSGVTTDARISLDGFPTIEERVRQYVELSEPNLDYQLLYDKGIKYLEG